MDRSCPRSPNNTRLWTAIGPTLSSYPLTFLSSNEDDALARLLPPLIFAFSVSMKRLWGCFQKREGGARGLVE